MRLTVKQLKEAVENKDSWKIEHFETEVRNQIGFSTGRGVWYWFVYFGDFNQEDSDLYFDHRYSCNNGTASRGLRTGLKAEEMILGTLNPDYEKVWS